MGQAQGKSEEEGEGAGSLWEGEKGAVQEQRKLPVSQVVQASVEEGGRKD